MGGDVEVVVDLVVVVVLHVAGMGVSHVGVPTCWFLLWLVKVLMCLKS